jgi:hypothetical protein
MKTRQVLHCTLLLHVAAAPAYAQSVRVEAEGGAAVCRMIAYPSPRTQLQVRRFGHPVPP